MTAASMRWRTPVLAACLLLLAARAQAEEPEAPTPPHRARPAASGARPTAPSPQAAEERALLRQLADAQRALGEQLREMKDAVDAIHNDVAAQKDQEDGTEQEVKALRDEVKGLYVESSTVKQQIDALKDDIGAVNSNVSAFRTYSGFFIAVMILLLAVIFVLTIRR
jgi:septal ring factor EnvC (AmiA/AmiB activator)